MQVEAEVCVCGDCDYSGCQRQPVIVAAEVVHNLEAAELEVTGQRVIRGPHWLLGWALCGWLARKAEFALCHAYEVEEEKKEAAERQELYERQNQRGLEVLS